MASFMFFSPLKPQSSCLSACGCLHSPCPHAHACAALTACPCPHLCLCMPAHNCKFPSMPSHTLISALKPSHTLICPGTHLCTLIHTFTYPCHACAPLVVPSCLPVPLSAPVHPCASLHHGCASSTPCPHHPPHVSQPCLLCCMLPHLCHVFGCCIAHWHHLKHIIQAKLSKVHHLGHHSCMASLSIKLHSFVWTLD